MSPEISPSSAAQPLLTPERMAAWHGAFIAVTGVWPLINLPSFEVVTGPKLEGWLVKGMGTVLTAVGLALLWSGRKRRVTPEIIGLANGTGLGLGVLDVVYVARRRIKPIYLADAAVEALFAAGWLAAVVARRKPQIAERAPLAGAMA